MITTPKVAEDASLIPVPKGYKVLVAIPEKDKKTGGGILLPDTLLDRERVGTQSGFVVALGPDAYRDTSKFSEPYCKEGDWVLFRAYSGTRFKVKDAEFRLINDDTVEAVVEDPRGIERA